MNHNFRYSAIFFCLYLLFISCSKDDYNDLNKIHRSDTDSTIYISDHITINDRIRPRDPVFSYDYYDNFLKKLISSDRFIFVPLNEFNNTYSSDKIVIGLRHDIDYHIESAIRFARREYENGIRATYYLLNTADYYSDIAVTPAIRKPSVLDYIKKLHNDYNHEIGWHNDLVTLQVVYNIDVKEYMTKELTWLRENGINIDGSSYHGSEFGYEYHYLNSYLWKPGDHNNYYGQFGPPFENYDSVFINGAYKKINKFEFSDFGFNYEAGLLNNNYFFADVFFFNNKRWNMSMYDWESLKPGDRVIILTHPAFWD